MFRDPANVSSKLIAFLALRYDIEDYQDVHAPYGNIADVDAIIAGCHERSMRVVFDLVINHCSYKHKWFLESRSSKTNAKRDWVRRVDSARSIVFADPFRILVVRVEACNHG